MCKQLILDSLLQTNSRRPDLRELNDLIEKVPVPVVHATSSNTDIINDKNLTFDVLIVSHGAFIKRIVKYLMFETPNKCVHTQDHADQIDKSIPNTAITSFEIKADLGNQSLVEAFAVSVNSLMNETNNNNCSVRNYKSRNEDNRFEIFNHLNLKCNYVNESGHLGAAGKQSSPTPNF